MEKTLGGFYALLTLKKLEDPDEIYDSLKLG
jgi:hypothetical protein